MANDDLGVAQSSIEFIQGNIKGGHDSAKALQKASALISADPNLVQFLHGSTMTQALGWAGIVISSLGIIIQLISVVRQQKTLSAVSELPASQKTDDDKEKLKEVLTNLKNLKLNRLLKSLPEYLKDKVTTTTFEDLLHDIDQDKPTAAQDLAKEIQTGVLKKQIVHILGAIACVFALLSSIALVIGCPLLVLTLLMVLGLTMTVSISLLQKGWVENPKDGFNWKLCLPEFLQKKMTIDKGNERELTNTEQFFTMLCFERFLPPATIADYCIQRRD